MAMEQEILATLPNTDSTDGTCDYDDGLHERSNINSDYGRERNFECRHVLGTCNAMPGVDTHAVQMMVVKHGMVSCCW